MEIQARSILLVSSSVLFMVELEKSIMRYLDQNASKPKLPHWHSAWIGDTCKTLVV